MARPNSIRKHDSRCLGRDASCPGETSARFVGPRPPPLCLEEIALRTAGGSSSGLSTVIQRAYAAGCTIQQVLAAIEAGQALGGIRPVAARAVWMAAQEHARIARRSAATAALSQGNASLVGPSWWEDAPPDQGSAASPNARSATEKFWRRS